MGAFSGGRFLAELAYFLLVLARAAGSTCLDDAVLPEARVGIDCGNGTLVPVGIFQMAWDSSMLTSAVAQILIQEVLGYNAVITGTGGSSASGMYAVAGCKDPNQFNKFQLAGCSGNATFLTHITLEVWGVSKVATMQDLLKAWPQIIPENVGSVGYLGEEGSYVFDTLASYAYETEGLPLNYYQGYDIKWHKAYKYFDNYTALDPKDMKSCSETGLTATAEISNYLRVTGDSDGVVSTPSGVQGRCWFDHYWFSPACRQAPETCILYLTGSNGWGMHDFMQRVSYYNMPFALAVAKTTPLYVALNQKLKTAPYWFRPDASFIERAPQMVVFPPADLAAQAKGIRLTSLANTVISKWVNAALKQTEHVLYDFVTLLSMPMPDIEAMMLDKKLNASSDLDVACRWLRRSRPTWSPWIPPSTACTSGQGMVDRNGTFVGIRSFAKSCDWCPEGWRSVPRTDSVGPTRICEPCPPGMSQGRPGQASCTPCALGTFAPGNASTDCARCPVAWYQDTIGSSTCLRCPGPATTLYMAATTAADCVCPAGTYQPLGENFSCVDCPDGMLCSSANSTEAAIPLPGMEGTNFPFPEAAPHYMTRPSGPLAPYLCRTLDLCPGGPPGACKADHDPEAIACGRCLPDMYDSTSRICSKCRGNELSIFIAVAVVGGVVVLCLLAYGVNGDVLRQPRATTAMLIIAGLSFTCLQTIGVFNDIAVKWTEPLKSIFYAVSLLSFDFRFLKVECAVGSNGVNKYILRLFVAPVGAVCILVILFIKKRFLNPLLRFAQEAVNTIGSLYSLFFIAIAISVLVPFVCYKHPGAQGWSLVQNPSIQCFVGGYHASIMAAGLVACAVVLLPFVALVGYGTINYPRFVLQSSVDGGVNLHMFRFLYFRYKPEAYYFGFLTLLRSLGLCLVPVAIRESGAGQVVGLAAILLGFALLQLVVQPWRSEVANIIDGVIAALLVLMLICSTMVSTFTEAERTAAVLGSIIFALLVVGVVVLFAYSLYLRLAPRLRFEHFISHHKADAATQARFLQLLLQRKTKREVFIDSDHLTDLDNLFDMVRGSVRWLIVLLTSDTLRRPWCAGEIAVAHQTHRRIKIIKTASFVPPKPEHLKDIGAYLHSSDTNLTELGISMEAIAASYEYLLSEAPVALLVAARPGRRRFEEVASALLGSSAPRGFEEGHAGAAAMMLVVSCDPEDDEAVSASGIIAMKLQEAVMDKASAGVYVLADHDLSQEDILETTLQAYAVIIVLSRGTMVSKRQLQAILTAGAEDIETVLVNTPTFRFPDDTYYTSTLPVLVPEHTKEAAAAMQRLFRHIAVFLATAASERVIDAQVMEVLARLPGAGRAGGGPVQAKTTLVRSGTMSSGSFLSVSLSKKSSDRSGQGIQRRVSFADPTLPGGWTAHDIREI